MYVRMYVCLFFVFFFRRNNFKFTHLDENLKVITQDVWKVMGNTIFDMFIYYIYLYLSLIFIYLFIFYFLERCLNPNHKKRIKEEELISLPVFDKYKKLFKKFENVGKQFDLVKCRKCCGIIFECLIKER
jgi:hypothetical protein